MKLANEDVGMLAFTSEQITAPFLLPEMVTLDFYHAFLIQCLTLLCNEIGGRPSHVALVKYIYIYIFFFISLSYEFLLTAG